MRVLTLDWTASLPPQAVPADIKAKTPDPLLRGFCRSRARPCRSVLCLRPRCVLGRIRIVSAYGFQGVLNDHVVLEIGVGQKRLQSPLLWDSHGTDSGAPVLNALW